MLEKLNIQSQYFEYFIGIGYAESDMSPMWDSLKGKGMLNNFILVRDISPTIDGALSYPNNFAYFHNERICPHWRVI